MKRLSFMIFILLCSIKVTAQEQQSIKVNSIEDNDDFARKVYKYDYFTDGRAFIKGEGAIKAKFNYNRLTDVISFIGSKGDTMELAAPEKTDGILINQDLFYYFNKGYVERISNYNKINLAVKSKMKLAAREVRGAMGIYSTSNDHGYLSNLDNDKRNKLGVDENDIYKIDTHYFFIDQNHNIYEANKKNLIALLPDHKEDINTFLDENKINFSNKQSLEKLLAYVQTLSATD